VNNKIYPCIWFNNNALEAANFYCSIFKNSKLLNQNPTVVNFEVENQIFMCLNGGPHFTPNPTISFYVTCETENEIDSLWMALIKNGSIRMPLNKYAWSKKYGWVDDKYGVSWQLTIGSIAEMGQKISPALLYSGKQFGKAKEAVTVYSEIFKPSEIHFLFPYPETDVLNNGKIAHGQISLLNQKFIVMDGGNMNEFSFSEGVSLVVSCDNQQEIDHYWTNLTKEGQESQCGWLKDKYGVSWQIVPSKLGKLMSNPEKATRVMSEIFKMKKINIKVLEKA
jgi:predicted 3-demethylubiquinone-9 3-methyltransferase (glyoxalase superfamily)